MIQTSNDYVSWRWWLLVTLNAVAAAISGGFGVLGLVAPAALPAGDIEITKGAGFFAAMYGARAVALAIVTIVVLVRARPGRVSALIPLLALAGIVQVCDAVIAVVNGTPGVVGPAIAAAIHLGSLAALLLAGRVGFQKLEDLGRVDTGEDAGGHRG